MKFYEGYFNRYIFPKDSILSREEKEIFNDVVIYIHYLDSTLPAYNVPLKDLHKRTNQIWNRKLDEYRKFRGELKSSEYLE